MSQVERIPERLDGESPSILVVDDDSDLREILKDELATRGFRVRLAGDGRSALDLIRYSQPDAIVFDMNMPTLDGWEFRIQQRLDPRLAGIPVVAMSGDESLIAGPLGTDAFIKKPFSADQLVALIAQVITSADHERRRAGRLFACERMATLGMLTAGIAHEINNPLMCMTATLDLINRGVSQLSKQGAPSPALAQVESDVNEACRMAGRLRTIVQDIRSFSRPDDHHFEPVVIRDVLETCIHVAWPQIRERARLVKDYADVPQVVGSESRMGQVFLNLLVNAAQAIAKGHADTNEIRIVTRRDEQDDRVRIEIQDTGSGMSPETLHQLFEPFFTTKPLETGTGLGLYVAGRLCREMGGEIKVRSVVGEGSTFGVILPSERTRFVRRPEEAASRPDPASNFSLFAD